VSYNITYLILTGGESRRFGSPKMEAVLNGKSLLAHIVDGIPNESEIIVAGPIPKNLSRGVHQVTEKISFGGPVSGISHGLTLVTTDYVAVIATDVPFGGGAIDVLKKDLSTKFDAFIPIDRQGSLQYLSSIFNANKLREAIANLNSPLNASLKILVKSLRVKEIAFAEWDSYLLKDIDTLKDLSDAESCLTDTVKRLEIRAL
jgi:molybdenum cofactor guanylyltransferase